MAPIGAAWYHWAMRFALPLLVVALALASCEDRSVPAQLERARGAGQAKIERLVSLAPLVRAAPPLADDAIEVQGPLPDFSDTGLPRDGIAAVLWLEELVTLDHGGAAPPARLREVGVTRAARLLRDGRLDESSPSVGKDAAEAALAELVGLRYVLVVRPVDWSPPQAQGIRYRRGRLRAEALLLDVERGVLCGGFRFQVANRDSLSTSSSDVQGVLLGDLRSTTRTAIRAGVARHLPGAVLPYSAR